jgi:filamentous hemagglutinin
LAAAVAWALPPGAGANLIGAQAGSVPALMANAAFNSLSAQAAIRLVNNRGDIGRTLEELASSDAVRATLAAALTAGVLERLNASGAMQALAQQDAASARLAHNLINAGGRALTNTAITGGDLEAALRRAIVGGVVDTAHGQAASLIKGLEADFVAHKLAHALAGCAAGAAVGSTCSDGAIGAAVGEIVARLRPPANGLVHSDAERAHLLGMSQLVAGAVAALAGGNAQTAIDTARVAVENNALKPALVGLLWLADRGITAWQVSQDLAAIRDGTKTVQQVAQERGEEYVVNAILGNLGRVGVEAVKQGGTWVQRRLPVADRAGDAQNATTIVRNAHLAGGAHPRTGIPFDRDGFPDFSSVALRTVQIQQTGKSKVDRAAANRAAGLRSEPFGYTWHHHQDGRTMQLVPTDIHRATGHTGGVALTKISASKVTQECRDTRAAGRMT